ncbi:membrane hypothetical protein [Gammaproteobacteria bacterium]
MFSKIQQNKEILFGFFVATLLCVFLWRYLSICQAYPYYIAWDMDLSTTIDVILINSGLIPSHFAHPGFGMYLIFRLTTKIAYFFGSIAIKSLADISASLNPIVGVAQLTDFLRYHTPFMLVGIAFFSWLSVYIHFKERKFFGLLLLLLLLTQSSFLHHAMLIRSEVYSLFFWSVGLFFGSCVIKSDKNFRKILYTTLTGFFIGLAFFTKVQSVFLVMLIPVMMLYFDSFYGFRTLLAKIDDRSLRDVAYASLINLLFFALMTIAAYMHSAGETGASFRSYGGIRLHYVFVFILLCLIVRVNLKDAIKYIALRPLLVFTTVAFSGFFCVFFITVFLYPHYFFVALTYSQLLFKVVFLGKIVSGTVTGLNPFYSVIFYIKHFSWLFSGVFLLLALMTYGGLAKNSKINRMQIFLFFVMLIVVLINITFAIRIGNELDMLWLQISLGLLFVAIALTSIRCFAKQQRLMGSLIIVMLAFLICNNLNKSVYPGSAYFEEYKFFSDVYRGNQEKYSQLMSEIYAHKNAVQDTSIRDFALDQASKYKSIGNLLDQLFYEVGYSLREVSALHPGFFISSSHIVKEVPSLLKGALVLNNSRRFFVSSGGGFKLHDLLMTMVVRHRYDKDIYLFMPEYVFYDTFGRNMVPNDMVIFQVYNDTDKKNLNYLGVLIDVAISLSSSINYDKLLDFVFVLKDKHS